MQGNKPIDTTKYTFDNLLMDIETLRAALGITKFMIGGHSVMGAIAHKYAAKYPEYVSHVVLIGTPRTFGTSVYTESVKAYWDAASEERKSLYQVKQKQIEIEKRDSLNPQEVFIKSLVASGPKRWHNPNLDATAFFERFHYNLDFLNHLFGKIISKYDLCSPEEKLNIPVFAAIGKSDYIGPPTLWNTDCQYLPKLTKSIFDESGHSPQYEQSKLFNKELVNWIKKN